MTEAPPPRQRWTSWIWIVAALLITILALYIGIQVIGVLYGMVMPPLPPLPGSAVETSHVSRDYGVDQWSYTTTTDACSVVQFYETNGGVCSVAQGQCNRADGEPVEWPLLAQCTGRRGFSIFSMDWRARIYAEDTGTRLEVEREIFWIGTGPATTPRFDFGELSSSPNATIEP